MTVSPENQGAIQHPDIEPDPQPVAPVQPEAEPQDLVGHPDVNRLAQSYRSSSAEAKRLYEENRRLQSQIDQVLPLALKAQQNGQVPDPSQQLSDLGIPVDALKSLVDARIQAEVQSALAPISQGLQARQRVLSDNPDFTKFESDVSRFLSDNPELQTEYNRTFSSNPRLAMEWAFLKYGQETRRTRAPAEAGKVYHEDAALKEAEMPAARSAKTRATEDSGASEELKKAWDYGNKFGDWRPYTKLRLRSVIPDEHLTK